MRDAPGFITLEIMTAIALVGAALAAAISVERGNAYWVMSARAANEDVSSTASLLGAAAVTQDFFRLVSAFAQDDRACSPSETCDGMRHAVTDASTCAKNVEVRAERHFPGYPMRTTSLSSVVTDPMEFVALGGDCALSTPSGNWHSPVATATADLGVGTPAGIDVFEGAAYLLTDAPPYLRIVTPQGAAVFSNGFVGAGPFNAIDVARDPKTDRVYAYVAATLPQLQIIDVTDPNAPELAASSMLAGVSLTGAQAQAWRVVAYGSTVYVAARYMISANPELHLFDVSDPTSPWEVGGGYKASTSVYGMVVHEQSVPGMQGARRRLLYLATTAPTAELKVLDVTEPGSITTVSACDLPGSYQATSLALLGTVLYAGRENVPSGGEDLYAFDASDPTAGSFCVPIGKTDIGTDGYSRHVQALRTSGPYLFVATTNTTNAHGQIQIRNADPSSGMGVLGTFALPGLAENGLDFENNTLYAASTARPQLQALTAP